MTSWAVVCDVWYLDPQIKKPEQSPEEFANQVKSLIARKAGLINVPWDGYYKYLRPSTRFTEHKQRVFAAALIKVILIEFELFFEIFNFFNFFNFLQRFGGSLLTSTPVIEHNTKKYSVERVKSKKGTQSIIPPNEEGNNNNNNNNNKQEDENVGKEKTT